MSGDQVAELRALVNGREVPAVVATRARIVLWRNEGRRRKDIVELSGGADGGSVAGSLPAAWGGGAC